MNFFSLLCLLEFDYFAESFCIPAVVNFISNLRLMDMLSCILEQNLVALSIKFDCFSPSFPSQNKTDLFFCFNVPLPLFRWVENSFEPCNVSIVILCYFQSLVPYTNKLLLLVSFFMCLYAYMLFFSLQVGYHLLSC